MKKLVFVGIGALFTLAGCASNSVQPIQASKLEKMKNICVATNEKVTVPAIKHYITDGFARYNIHTQFYNAALPKSCEYKLTYTVLRSWDVDTYISVITMDLTDHADKVVANVNWEQNHFALNKWRNDEGKVFDAIDQLLGKKNFNAK